MNVEQLNHARHTAAHLLASAVIEQFPGVQLGIGPTIEYGFYYDFLFPEGVTFSDSMLPKLEKQMKKLIAQNLEMTGEVVSEDQARAAMDGQPLKLQLIDELAAGGEELSLYTIGKFTDLCRGGHSESSKDVPAVGLKLQRVAGAYWKGDENNPMLTRIYGLLFATAEELEAHLEMLEQAKLRDHRKIGREQELFFIDEQIGKGLPLWLPNGTIMRNEIERLAVETEDAYGYVRVSTPHLAKKELFERSGHLPYYADSMYPGMEIDDGTYYLKAMNCPLHHVMYNHRPRSFRELPLRFAEYGMVYRNELSGTLAGLLRVRALEQNDAHIYATRDQIREEIRKVIELTRYYFTLFGLNDYWFRLSKWDPEKPEKYLQEPENWEFAEGVLREELELSGVKFVEVVDEAAFYGPKIDVQFRSVIGREETMSTVQLDFIAKTRFDLHYTDSTGAANNEVYVIHRAPLSTHERFMAFIIEHFAGSFPVWLSPVQVQLISVGEAHRDYVDALVAELRAESIRAAADHSDQGVGKKIRGAVMKKVPYMLVIGDKEMESDDLMIRKRGEQDAVAINKQQFITELKEKIAKREIEL